MKLAHEDRKGQTTVQTVDRESPIGQLFFANVSTQRVEITNHLGEVEVYTRIKEEES